MGKRIQLAQWIWFLAGAGVLLLGVSIYLVDRPVGSAQWLPRAGAWRGAFSWGAWAGNLPSAAHAFAFGLMTALVMPRRGAWRAGACIAWGAIDMLAEAAQHEHLRAGAASLGQAVLGHGTLGQAWVRYVVAGRFDWGDLAAVFAATVLALVAVAFAAQETEIHHA
jgi:hypothetical protein